MYPTFDGGAAQDRCTRQDKKKIARTTKRLKRLNGRLPEETADFVEELSADFTDYADFFRLNHKHKAMRKNRE
jgi:short-subunit dehydrogenase